MAQDVDRGCCSAHRPGSRSMALLSADAYGPGNGTASCCAGHPAVSFRAAPVTARGDCSGPPAGTAGSGHRHSGYPQPTDPVNFSDGREEERADRRKKDGYDQKKEEKESAYRNERHDHPSPLSIKRDVFLLHTGNANPFIVGVASGGHDASARHRRPAP